MAEYERYQVLLFLIQSGGVTPIDKTIDMIIG